MYRNPFFALPVSFPFWQKDCTSLARMSISSMAAASLGKCFHCFRRAGDDGEGKISEEGTLFSLECEEAGVGGIGRCEEGGGKSGGGKEQLCTKAFQTASKIAFAPLSWRRAFLHRRSAGFPFPFVFKPFFEKTGCLQGV